ncbi:hypothetical protein AUC61_23800 [Pseudomonas sp. S25]|uniref:Uncharacterized protein n=1 Tax=Pseudomonas maioricensis TaxID=1766623 RepID=A0ABS9ZPR3_9PSED|nr:hypothetical protein [Pseudomonas sp. S25]MCI8212559.1 hypothetical protein [Pseudomonas sp. S25]
MREAIHEDALRAMIEQNVVREARVSRLEGKGWYLAVRLGGPASSWLPVRSKREAVRTWASLDTLTRWADGVGLRGYVLEL